MEPAEFRKHAHELVDWMADYLERIEDRDVVPNIEPGAVRRELPTTAPDAGEPFTRVFADFKNLIVPAMSHWQHPGWFGYFPANSSPPSVLAEMLTATLGAQCMSWETSPAATELEQTVMGWLTDMLDLPADFTGVIQDTASTATLVALLSARERCTEHRFGSVGSGDASPFVVYASDQAHASVDKAVKLAGLGLKNLRRIPSDEHFAMRVDLLSAAMEEDLKAGCHVTAVVATVGTTSTGAVDPLVEIGEICRDKGVWLHVDAAWAGSAAICPEHRSMLAGVEYADSFLFNPHKWLLTNFDCTAYFVRDVETLVHTFSTTPDYLRTRHDSEVVNYRDWQIQLGRRFRALKLWFVIRNYGVEGLREMIRTHITLAAEFADRVETEPRLELASKPSLGLVCFRAQAGDAASEELLRRVNGHGDVFLTHTRLGDRFTLRLSVGQRTTQKRHVDRAWEHILDALSRDPKTA